MTKEIYWLDYGKQKVTKKEATATGKKRCAFCGKEG